MWVEKKKKRKNIGCPWGSPPPYADEKRSTSGGGGGVVKIDSLE
jgi:hypothetical protein